MQVMRPQFDQPYWCCDPLLAVTTNRTSARSIARFLTFDLRSTRHTGGRQVTVQALEHAFSHAARHSQKGKVLGVYRARTRAPSASSLLG
jgi:hypothetical protein